MADDKSRSRYACDYCWKKKLRCSREKPKCKNCSAWTSDCTYSREPSDSKRGPDVHTESTASDLLEQAGQHRDSSSGLAVLPSCSDTSTAQDQQPGFGDETHSSVTSTFSDTHNVLNFNQMRNSLADITSQGSGMLSDLYDQFKDSTYDYDKIKAAVKMARRDHEPFFIPTEPIGAMFIQCFLTVVDRGYPLLSRPPQEMLFDLVFRPSSVDKRGWVLMLNTILATASTQNQQLSEYTFQLRWNAWLAADEASLFMEPTILNIQAWTVFAVHGQDLVTPSLCWNLINQVCRMAQMIKLPLPSASAKRDSELHSRSLCLFWSLFITEKSLSLSFGCPPVLPSALYRNLELPSPKQLSAYRPHLSGAGTDRPPHVEFFGAFYFVQCTKLAMIMGDMSDFYLLSSHDPGRHLELKRRLDQWISVVEQVSKSDENE
ncbi:hypothetical protein AYO21_09746 [Fonsecaea monophora]|uniref:Zn(2)-C6 fungal-type domain-containing protein n=1 Tax=Fonsecaea monophora TaxID=254056 RepID=A0A177EVP9_9EURO|nr:hypothetical protein AYO21_09746 [Fonsecaea monophora]OAG36028.1 hypothetical protein AYO21_09746 [Fonsecaea monophora]